MRVPVSINYLRVIWALGKTGKKSTRVCRTCAALVSPDTHVYQTTTTGVLKGIGPKDVVCVKCALDKTDGIAHVDGVEHVEI